MKRAIVLALTTICAAALFAVPAHGKARKAQTTRPGRAGVCVVVVKQGGRSTTPQRTGVKRSPRCRGPRGLRGPRGKQGPRGANGQNGANGKDGSNGTNGTNGATGPAGPKGDKGDPGAPYAGTRFAHVATSVTTSSPTFAELPGSPGPSVTVTVPESGTIQVAASVVAVNGDGAVSLYRDGVQMPEQSDICVPDAGGGLWLPGVLFDANADFNAPDPVRFATGAGAGLMGACSTTGAPSQLVFQTTPGRHTFELRYALSGCGCSPAVSFSERKLWVTPLP